MRLLAESSTFDRKNSTSVLGHFVKSGFLIGREVQVEVKPVGRSKDRKDRSVEYPKNDLFGRKLNG